MRRRLAIIDTNVVVAGLLTKAEASPTARILSAMLEASIPYVVSVQLLGEYREVMMRDSVRTLHQLTDDQVDRLLTDIALNAIVVEPDESGLVAPDSGDQHVWDLLLAPPSAILVTGDQVLVKEAPSGASVVTPRAYVELMGWF